MVSLLVTLLILCLVASLIWWILGMLPLPPPVRNIVLVVFAVVVLIWLLEALPLGGLGLHSLR